MYSHRETNRHFLPPEQPSQRPTPPETVITFPTHQQPHLQRQQPPQQQPRPPQPQQHVQRDQRRQRQPQQQPPLSLPSPRITRPITWFLGIFCALLWIIIIVGGLAILLVYLLLRPRSPKFDISSASLNQAYLDMGYLNADLTLLANFTNPSKKVSVDFSYMVIDLYYQGNRVATRYIHPFSVMRTGSRLSEVEMVTSQFMLPWEHSQRLQREMDSGRVRFEVRGLFRTRSNLGIIFRYSYWLYGHCVIVVTSPPSGVLVAKKCRTKR